MWILAASGIVIPLVIHLWNIREGKTLKVGSVALLVESSRQRARSLQLKDILLLILRCLLILLLASLLAMPFWSSRPAATPEKGWVVLERETAAQAYKRFRPQIDSLIGTGMRIHYFEQGFGEITQPELATVKDTASHQMAVSYWGLLQALQKAVPHALPVYLYTSNRLSAFRGTKPRLSLPLHWQTFTPADSLHQWLSAAQLSSDDSIRLLEAVSSPDALQYQVRSISATRPAAAGYRVGFEQGKMLLTKTDTARNDQYSVEVDTATLRMIVYTDSYTADAKYLEAALGAIGRYAGRRMEIKRAGHPEDISGKPDWLFWLSDHPLPAYLKAANILQYQTGTPESIPSWIVEAGQQTSAEPLPLYKLIRDTGAITSADLAVWEDGFGYPVLLKSSRAAAQVFSLYTHLNPQWNDLPWSNRFPVLLMRLIIGEKDTDRKGSDMRMINPKQVDPEIVDNTSSATVQLATGTTDLSKPVWIFTFLILLLERIVNFHRKTEKPV